MSRLLLNPFVVTALVAALATVATGCLILWRGAIDAGTAAGGASISAHPDVAASSSASRKAHAADAFGTLDLVDGGSVPIADLPLQIGRHSSNDVRLDDVRVSRHHARIDRNAEGAIEIHNITASRSEPNPMLVNGVYSETATLRDGDIISLGGVEFTYHGKVH